MKQLSLTSLFFFFVLISCNNKSGQVTNTLDDPDEVTDPSEQITDSAINLTDIVPAEQIVDTSTQVTPDPSDGELQDPAQRVIDTTDQSQYTRSPTDDVIPDPAEIIIGGDPLEGINTEVVINPAHGKPGHRCDFPVGSDIGMAPPTIGMSLCE